MLTPSFAETNVTPDESSGQSVPLQYSEQKIDSEPDNSGDEVRLPMTRLRRAGAVGRGATKITPPPRSSRRLQHTHNGAHRQRTSSSSSQTFGAVVVQSPSADKHDSNSPQSSEDEDDMPPTLPSTRRRPQRPRSVGEENCRRTTLRTRAERPIRDTFIVNNDEIEYISSDNAPVTPSKSRKLSRTHKSPGTPRRQSRRERQELEEDLEDLKDSDNVATKSRTRGAPVNKEREKTRKHFELLKRRRAGEKALRALESGNDMGVVHFGHAIQNAPDYVSSSDAASIHSSQDTDAPPEETGFDRYDDDDFIVDDPNDRLGVPHHDMPLEFTSYASAKPRDLFIHVIEWLVKNKISPAFSRHDQFWSLAFNKIDDEVKGQAGSRLISSAWTATFRRTLEARPGICVTRLPGNDEDNIRTCDACNRTNHPAQYDFVFRGKAYHHKTLEPIDNSDDDESDEDDEEKDKASVDSKNHVLPPESQHFYLGRYCAANAEMGHKLTHWLFHLNQSLLAYLDEQGVLDAENIVKRDKMNHKKREKQAEGIVDEMKDSGVVEDLWKEFRNDLNDARLGMEGYEKRGGRS